MQAIQRASFTDLFLVALTALIWASAFIAIKVAVPETGPYWLAASRVAIGFLVLLPYAAWKGFILPKTGRVWLLVCGMSLLNVVIPFLLISWAELSIDAGVTSLLMGTGPFFALLGSHFFTHDDKLTTAKVIGVVCGFGGVLVIVGFDAIAGLGRTNLLAQFACFLASLCYVVSGLLIRRIDIPPGRLACLALGISTAILVVLAYLGDGSPDLGLSTQGAVALLYLGLIPTGLAYIMRFYLIRKIGYSTFAVGLNLIPVFGVILGILMLGEALSIRIVLALMLIVCGLFIARLEPRKRMPENAVND